VATTGKTLPDFPELWTAKLAGSAAEAGSGAGAVPSGKRG
jgi:hypothetical protein